MQHFFFVLNYVFIGNCRQEMSSVDIYCKALKVSNRTCGATAWRCELGQKTDCRASVSPRYAGTPQPFPTQVDCALQTAQDCADSLLWTWCVHNYKTVMSNFKVSFCIFCMFFFFHRMSLMKLLPALMTPCTPVSSMQWWTSLRCWMFPLAKTGMFTASLYKHNNTPLGQTPNFDKQKVA